MRGKQTEHSGEDGISLRGANPVRHETETRPDVRNGIKL